MTLAAAEIAEIAMASLTQEERREAILYLDERWLEAGEKVETGETAVRVRARTAVAFVDRQPAANWGHDCRYLLIDVESGAVRSVEAEFPPFLKGVPGTLRVVWRGEGAPEWAVATG